MIIFEYIEDLLADKRRDESKLKDDKSLDKHTKSTHRKLMVASLGTAAAMAYPSVVKRAAMKTAGKSGEYVGKAANYTAGKLGDAGIFAGKKIGKATAGIVKHILTLPSR